jgi:HEAT repeat protein
VNIVVAEGLDEVRVSADLNGVAIDDALRTLLAAYDTFFFYDGLRTSPAELRTVWVFPKGSASALRPVRAEQWASRAELEAALGDTDPEVRAAAYEALLSRPDQRSRSLVIDALSGSTERHAGVRERLLSDAMSKGFAVPDEVLGQLARADSSDQIRWIALDALSHHPSAKQIAEAALADPSEAVRLRAKEVLIESESRPAAPPANQNE